VQRLPCLLLLILYSSFLFGQQYVTTIKKLETKDGLNGQIKYHSLVDRNGFLWLSSAYGIDRYDGQEVLNIRLPATKDHRSQIMEIWEGPDGLIWVISGFAEHKKNILEIHLVEFQVNLISPKTGRILSNEKYFSDASFLTANNIRSFEILDEELILCTKDGTLLRFDNGFAPINKITSPTNSLWQWTIDSVDNFYYFSNDTLFSMKDNKVNHFRILGKDSTFSKIIWTPQFGIQSLIRIKNKDFVGHTFNRDLVLQEKTSYSTIVFPFLLNSPENSRLKKIGLNFILEDNTGSEVFNFQKKFQESFKNLHWVNYHPRSNLLVAQTATNLLLIHVAKNPFKNYLNDHKPQVSTRGIATSPNNKIVVNLGLQSVILDESGKSAKYFESSRTKFGQYLSAAKSKYDSLTNSFWVFNTSGVFNVDLGGNLIKSYRPFLSLAIQNMERIGSEKELIFFGENGIFTIDESSSFLVHRSFEGPEDKLNSSKIVQVTSTDNGALFFTQNEIYSWDEQTNEVDYFKTYPKSISKNKILEIYHRNQNEIWFATTTGGIFCWKLKEDTTLRIGKENGLSSNIIYAILEDKYGYFWLPSTYGLNRYHPEKKTNSIYTTEHGLPHNEFNTYSHHQSKSGSMYLGGLNG